MILGRPFMKKIILEIKNLTKKYESFTAVHNANMKIFEGSIICLLGPNGAGKTTILRMITMLTLPTRGEIIFRGTKVTENILNFKRKIGIVPQEPAFYNSLTVMENLELMGGMYDMPGHVIKEKAGKLLRQFGIEGKKETQAKKLSGGEKRKLNFCMTLMHEPELVLLDEPTVGFDPVFRGEAWEEIGTLRDMGITILLTTHYMDEAEALSDYIYLIDKGRIIAEGTANKLKSLLTKECVINLVIDKDKAMLVRKKLRKEIIDSCFDGKHLRIVFRRSAERRIKRELKTLGIKEKNLRKGSLTLDDVFRVMTKKKVI